MYFYINKEKINNGELEILGSTPIPINPASLGVEVLIYEGESEPTLEEIISMRKSKIEPQEDENEVESSSILINPNMAIGQLLVIEDPIIVVDPSKVPMPLSELHKPSRVINPLKRVVFKGRI